LRTGFRTKVFIGSVAAAAVSLAVAASLVSWEIGSQQRRAIEQRLTDEAHLIADLLSAAPAVEGAALDREADRLGQFVGRVTFVAADGRVVGDSTQDGPALDGMENHATRPEILSARDTGLGVSSRASATLGTDMLYVAVTANHPVVRYVRVALPLQTINAQLATIRRLTLIALAAAVPAALLLAWLFSAPLSRRVEMIAKVAKRYSSGDLSRSSYDYGTDELGIVARALDASVQELGRRFEELSRDRARMGAILAGMVEGVLVVDRHGRLQLVNDAAQTMLRVDDATQGRRYVEVIRHPDIAAQLATALRGEAVDTRELVLNRDPSHTFIARAAAVEGGGAVLVLHDITDLRRADQIRRDFVANVSHELRTPLTAIRGYAEALLDDPGDIEQSRRFLETIARQGARMERLVTDLLRLARLDAKQEALEVVPCEIRQIFIAVVADLSPTIEAKRQHVMTEVAPEAAVIQADPAKLHDVLRNLVENAVNYSPDDANVKLTAARNNGLIAISVSDSGPGIPSEDLTRVFERFYRVDKSRSRPGGTGLGLAIVKHLVGLHGGDAIAENRPEGGAKFTVTIPESPSR
jgi:two-component system, OmpR family, phosphate regulon sensor histidine kinase PhoR